MNIEDIKVGETYNVRVTVEGKGCNGCWLQARTGEHGSTLILRASEAEAFSPISPENGIKNTETASKPDPCRLFRKGDKVRVVEWNGRNYYDLDHGTKLETGCLAEIWEDEEAEQQEGYVSVIYQGYIRSVPPCYLELVTPVEEHEPYSVSEDTVQYLVKEDNKKVVAQFCKLYHPHAKAAAEAECARLNAERRKEME